MSDDDFIRNRREMFYDRRFEAALETAAEAEQAEATAGLDAGVDVPRWRCQHQVAPAEPVGTGHPWPPRTLGRS